MKICLICPPYQFEGYAPVGLASLAAVAEEDGYEVEIVDLNVHPTSNIPSDMDLIGITGLSLWQENIEKVAMWAKMMEVPYIVGGNWATQMPMNVLKETQARWVFAGEGEKVFADFLEAYRFDPDHDLMRNKIIYGHPIRDLDSLPMPDWFLLDLNKYSHVAIETSRGCPFCCCFCAVHVYNGRGIRFKSVKRVVNEIGILAALLEDGQRITFGDANLTYDVDRFERICDGILKRKIKAEFDVIQGVRADRLPLRLLEKMKKAGFVEVIIAPESGSQRVINDIIHKNLDVGQVMETARNAKKVGLNLGAFFVIGFPDETLAEIQQTLDMAAEMRKMGCSTYVGNALPLFGTPLYESAKKNGFLRFDGKELEDNINSLGIPRKVHCLTSPHWQPEQIVEICKSEHKKNLRNVYRFYSKKDLIKKSLLHPNRALKKLRKML